MLGRATAAQSSTPGACCWADTMLLSGCASCINPLFGMPFGTPPCTLRARQHWSPDCRWPKQLTHNHCREPTLPAKYVPELRKAAADAGVDWDKFQVRPCSCTTYNPPLADLCNMNVWLAVGASIGEAWGLRLLGDGFASAHTAKFATWVCLTLQLTDNSCPAKPPIKTLQQILSDDIVVVRKFKSQAAS